MMRRFVKNVCASRTGRFRGMVLAALAGCAALITLSAEVAAQEIQLTGPLAGAPAVRKLRLHRKGRFEFAPGVSFTLLDQYQRTIMPGAKLTYHPTDWLGIGLWGGYGFQYTANIADELQTKAIEGRDCAERPSTKACRLTAVNLTRGNLAQDQLGKIQWVLAPQVTVVPFRGKLALFSALFFDTDVNIFAGPAIVGLQERAPCGKDTDGKDIPLGADGGGGPCANQASFTLQGRVAIAPTFGLGLNFYPHTLPLSFGFEWRAIPFSWNTAGFDNYGGGTNQEFPDNSVNSADREFHFNSMLTVNVGIQFPTSIKTTD